MIHLVLQKIFSGDANKMKIMHLMLACFYIDNYSYQENLLPKYHKKQGHDVEIVASLVSFDENGNSIILPKGGKYQNEYGIPVTRLEYSKSLQARRLRKYIGLKEELERFQPDLLFIHGVQFSDISVVVNYLQDHKNVILYVDSHSDFSNSGTNWFSKTILHEIIWRHYAQLINPYVRKFYGVLPARVDFLINEYKIPKEKVELLLMGADDERVYEAAKPEVKEKIRKKLNLADDDFVVMTGGKIDAFKTQTLLLMEAVHKINDPKVKLIVFGSVTPELKKKVNELSDGKKNQYIGWVNAEESYDYFAASDLVVFPGRHSVFWEQVAAQGKPMIVKYWEGTTHIDFGGNVRFLYEDSVNEIERSIREILTGDEYGRMLAAAKKASVNFMYSKIAQESIRG